MTDEINRKVTNIFSRHNKSLPPATEEKVKFYAGFNYVRIDRDTNGNKFNPDLLLKYAQGCHYIVRVMREYKGETDIRGYSYCRNFHKGGWETEQAC